MPALAWKHHLTALLLGALTLGTGAHAAEPIDTSQADQALWGPRLGLNPTGLVYQNPGLQGHGVWAPRHAYLGLGWDVGMGLSAWPSHRLDLYAGVGFTLRSAAASAWGPAAPGMPSSALEGERALGLREQFGGMTLMPSASIGLVYRY